jgi:hypothetical protein
MGYTIGSHPSLRSHRLQVLTPFIDSTSGPHSWFHTDKLFLFNQESLATYHPSSINGTMIPTAAKGYL